MIESLQQLFSICDEITVNSNQVSKKSLFIAYPGSTFDGRDFIGHVIKSGAAAILYDKNNFEWKKEWKLPHLGIDKLKKRLPEIASEFYGNPSDSLRILGITGTNGKTTSVQWLSSCLNQLNRKTGFIGTTGYGEGANINSTKNTTPDIFTIQKIIREFKEKKISNIAMEVSSHAIDQGRIDNLKFDIKLLTNITRDHLDYHGNIENYIKCKSDFLLNKQTGEVIIVNNDDPIGHQIIEETNKKKTNLKILTFGIKTPSDLMAKDIIVSDDRTTFDLHHNKNCYKFDAPIFSRYNLYNLLGVIGCLIELKITIKNIQFVVSNIIGVEGRAEVINRNSNNQPNVYIDYAHTPDALKNILEALKQRNPKTLTLLFGCGGNRDKGKRKEMGEIANQLADKVIITSDNPRDESPIDIIDEISRNINIPFKKFENREVAIVYAVENMNENDILLIAGKGHEDYQEIKGKKYPFSDKKIVLNNIRKNVNR
jgi:UDP-N-acetylmuramoyl-L-alanyl-D-glutamate--2,6-diaminopimelate ligase|tara:strand:+ start:509 stop:1960 length:1452 start_codon:yes stop_codon:yes gene_type:complete